MDRKSANESSELGAPDRTASGGGDLRQPGSSAGSATSGGDLLRQALGGDARSWNELVRLHTPFLLRVAASYRLDDEAQDAVQVAFVRLLENASTIRNPNAVKSWLATTVQHECLKTLRRRNRESPTGDDADWDELLPASGQPPLDDELLRREERELLHQALSGLRRRDRELLVLLSDPDTDSYTTVSQRLGMPIGSIGPTRQRTLLRVRDALGSLGLQDCA